MMGTLVGPVMMQEAAQLQVRVARRLQERSRVARRLAW